jgi:hypothetical protein
MMQEIPGIRMKLDYCEPMLGYDGLLLGLKPEKVEKGYGWSSDFLDAPLPAWLQLSIQAGHCGLFSKDIETHLTFVPKNPLYMPVESAVFSREPGYESGFTVIQELGRDKSQHFGLKEFNNRKLSALTIAYSDQQTPRNNLMKLLNIDNFPFTPTIYKMLEKSYHEGEHEDRFEFCKRVALKRLKKLSQ